MHNYTYMDQYLQTDCILSDQDLSVERAVSL